MKYREYEERKRALEEQLQADLELVGPQPTRYRKLAAMDGSLMG